MPNVLILIGCTALGAFLATWKGQKKWWTYAAGIACGASVAFATVSLWYLLALVVFLPLVIWRRKVAS